MPELTDNIQKALDELKTATKNMALKRQIASIEKQIKQLKLSSTATDFDARLKIRETDIKEKLQALIEKGEAQVKKKQNKDKEAALEQLSGAFDKLANPVIGQKADATEAEKKAMLESYKGGLEKAKKLHSQAVKENEKAIVEPEIKKVEKEILAKEAEKQAMADDKKKAKEYKSARPYLKDREDFEGTKKKSIIEVAAEEMQKKGNYAEKDIVATSAFKKLQSQGSQIESKTELPEGDQKEDAIKRNAAANKINEREVRKMVSELHGMAAYKGSTHKEEFKDLKDAIKNLQGKRTGDSTMDYESPHVYKRELLKVMKDQLEKIQSEKKGLKKFVTGKYSKYLVEAIKKLEGHKVDTTADLTSSQRAASKPPANTGQSVASNPPANSGQGDTNKPEPPPSLFTPTGKGREADEEAKEKWEKSWEELNKPRGPGNK